MKNLETLTKIEKIENYVIENYSDNSKDEFATNIINDLNIVDDGQGISELLNLCTDEYIDLIYENIQNEICEDEYERLEQAQYDLELQEQYESLT